MEFASANPLSSYADVVWFVGEMQNQHKSAKAVPRPVGSSDEYHDHFGHEQHYDHPIY